jgi:hypothetical protein
MKRHVDAAVVCRAVGMDDVVVACRQAGVQSSRELVEHEAMFHFEHAHRALGRIVAKPDVAGWRKVLD